MSTHFIGIFVDIGVGNYLVAPLYVTAVWINPKWLSTLDTFSLKLLKNPTTFKARIMQCLKESNSEALLIQTRALTLELLDYYGLEVAAQKAVREVNFYLKARINLFLGEEVDFFTGVLHSNSVFELREPKLVQVRLPVEEVTQIKVALLYCRMLRQEALKNHAYYYPYLDLEANKGAATPKHLLALTQLKLLPPFYLKHKTIVYTLSYCLKHQLKLPDWLNHYLKGLLNERFVDSHLA